MSRMMACATNMAERNRWISASVRGHSLCSKPSIASSTTSLFAETPRFSASFSTRFHCSGVKRMFFCVVCIIRFVAPFVKIFIDSVPKRSDNSCFLTSNTPVANREKYRIDAGIHNTKSVSIIAQHRTARYHFSISAGERLFATTAGRLVYPHEEQAERRRAHHGQPPSERYQIGITFPGMKRTRGDANYHGTPRAVASPQHPQSSCVGCENRSRRRASKGPELEERTMGESTPVREAVGSRPRRLSGLKRRSNVWRHVRQFVQGGRRGCGVKCRAV